MSGDKVNKEKSNLERAKELLNAKKSNDKNDNKFEVNNTHFSNVKGNTKGIKKYIKGSTNGS